MALKEQILADLKTAMKSGDSARRDVLRMLDSAIKNTEIEKKKRETGLSDEEILEVIMRSVKQRQDSIRQFEEGGRADLAEKERQEIAFLAPYLPEQLSEEEIRAVVKEIVSAAGTISASDMGRIMGQAMGKLKGKADGNVVRKIVQEEL